jgi:hypothetical protein
MKKSILLALLISCAAHADIVCKGQSQLGPVQVDIAQNTVTVSGADLSKPVVFTGVTAQYDGHETELMTAPGLAISFKNDYGCIRNAQITTNLRDATETTGLIEVVSVSVCTGGSTPDNLCTAQ